MRLGFSFCTDRTSSCCENAIIIRSEVERERMREVGELMKVHRMQLKIIVALSSFG